MASDWPRLDMFLSHADASARCPQGWTVHQIADLFDQLPVGKRFDKKMTSDAGRVPVIDQSRSGFIGFHNETPGILATALSPIVTFANHTCEMRLMRQPFSVIQNVFPMRPSELCASAEALYYLTKGRVFLEEYKGHFPTFRSCYICLPPLPEQRAIAATLGALDDKIELNRKMNATLEAMARALFRDWFVDFGPTRAKMEGAAPYLSPDLWSLFPDRLDAEGKPEGWAYEPLLEQAEWVNGAAYKNMHFSDEPDALPVIKIAELKNGVTGNTQRTATDLGARYLIDDGELLFSWSGNPDTSIDTFLWTGGKAWLNQHIFAVRPNGKRSKPYMHVLLKFLKPEFAELARNKQTTGLGHVTKADMQRMMVCAASPEVHKAFDHLIEPIFKQALGLQMETRTLSQTRDLLLPRLISGELRVGDLASFDQEAVA